MITRNSADQVGSRFNKFMMFSMILALSVMSMVASARGSEVSISLWNNETFEIEFDHKRYYSDCDFEITDLTPGKHRVRITKRSNNPYGGGVKVSVLYNGFIDVPRHKKVIAMIHHNRRLTVVRTIDLRPQGCDTYGGNTYGGNQYDAPWGGTGYIGGGSNGTGSYGTTQSNGDCGYTTAINHMSDRDVNRLINDLERACFDDDRLAMAKRRLRHKQVDSYQVRMIIETLWFECNRVALAKFAYERVSDPGNFHEVYEAFDFNSSVNILEEYIHG